MKLNRLGPSLRASDIGAIAVVAIIACLMLAAPPSAAATFTVSNTADSGAGSLRAAIGDAQAAPGPNVIEFARHVRGTIVLTSGAIVIYQDLTINGPGAHRLSLSGNDADRIFDIEGNISQGGSGINVSISGLKIKHGLATSGSPHSSAGGAIYVGNGAVLNLSGIVLSHNQVIDNVGGTAEGGAIAIVTSGSVNASDVTVQRNRALSTAAGAALGGGLSVDATSSLSLTDSLVALNEALGSPGIGGGVYTLGTFSFDASTSITTNKASTSGNDIGP